MAPSIVIGLNKQALDRIKAARVHNIITIPKMNPNGKENYKTAPANT